ncbi:DUF2799 domain-containing protein [Castellaniella hirudinis]|uniref:DUF2799 domain-containing protein n=1 Tax=Castellaniella hirudinis TaxID=1144617 RepID=UPI0039C237A6
MPAHPHVFYRSFHWLMLGLGVALLSACASMSESECLTADWVDQGMRDGRQGYAVTRVADHYEACAGVGVVPDTAQYRQGYDKGIAQYCTPENGANQGRAGRSYRGVCPAHLEAAFLAPYRHGLAVYNAQQRVERLNNESRQLQYTLDKEKDPDKQRRLRNQLRDLDDSLRRARADLANIDRNRPY